MYLDILERDLNGYLLMKKAKFFLARAGSGKSYFATNLNRELENKHVLFITYTNMNTQVLLRYLRKSPINFKSKRVENWNEFLMNNFLMPYKQNYLKKLKIKEFLGISWARDAWQKKTWTDEKNNLFGYKCSYLLDHIPELVGEGCNRLARFYDYIIIDEFQDITGYDIIFLKGIMNTLKQTSLMFHLFGDIYQSNVQYTNTAMLIHNMEDIENEEKFIKKKYGEDIEIDRTTLEKSRRIGIGVSNFINKYMHIKIEAYESNMSTVFPSEITKIPSTTDKIENIFKKVDKILVYNRRSLKKVYKKFENKCINWGYSKGETYEGEIAVVLTKSIYEKLRSGQDLHDMATGTFTKFYVALTRSKSSVYLVYLAQ